MMLPCACIDHRHAPDDAVALGANAEQAAPGRGVFEDRHVPQQTRETVAVGLRIAAQRRHAPRSAAAPGLRGQSRQAGFAEHDLGLLDGVGQDLVVARQRPQLVPGLLVEIAKTSAASAGDSRSGSANTTSKAMAAAPSLVSAVIRSAMRVRGHGNWPSLRRLSSSISTMTTGRCVATRGLMTWKMSKARRRSSSSGAGLVTRRKISANSSATHNARADVNRRARRESHIMLNQPSAP